MLWHCWLGDEKTVWCLQKPVQLFFPVRGLIYSPGNTHTHNRLTAFTLGLPGWAGTRRNIHPLTPILIIGHPLSTSSIYNDPWHPLCSVYVLDNPLGQPLSRSSLVFLLVLDPQLHTPCISSPSRHLLFAAHVRFTRKTAVKKHGGPCSVPRAGLSHYATCAAAA